MFYGYETLGELLRHTKDMVSTMEDYKDKYSTISEFETEELEER